MNYYLVTAKCGHVGTNKYIAIVFPIFAESGKAAASYARRIPRVKHDHKDAIINVEKVSYEKYLKQCEENHNDPYLQVTSKMEQKCIEGFEDRLENDDHRIKLYGKQKYKSEKNTEYKRKKYNIRLFDDYECAI